MTLQPGQTPASPEAWTLPAPMPRPQRLNLSANTFVALGGVFLGVLIFTGLVTLHAVFLIPPPGFNPGTNPDLIAYRNTVRLLGWISIVAMDLAVSVSVTIAWLVGGLKGELSDSARRGLFIFSSVFLFIWLFLSNLSYSLIRSLGFG